MVTHRDLMKALPPKRPLAIEAPEVLILAMVESEHENVTAVRIDRRPSWKGP